MTNPHSRIIFPLDVATEEEAHTWCRLLKNEVGVMKVGLQLFTALGPRILEVPRSYGFDVFLDLKLHDIPATVKEAAKEAAKHRVRFLTVHASGGPAMLKAAVEGAREGQIRDDSPPTTILAVTVLTSISPEDIQDTFGFSHDIELIVMRMGKMAVRQGVQGFVCSPQEVGALRQRVVPKDTLLVVPGVRPLGADDNDQKRVATPTSAMKEGASHLVVGRPIRNASAPVEVARQIAEEIRPFVE